VSAIGSASAIEADGLGKRYGRTWALRDCSLVVPKGCVLGLVGANGAGKTTLLHLIVGLLQSSAGRVTVLGGPPAASATELARVGFLAQDAPLYSTLTIADHLRLGAHMNPRWDASAARARIEELGLDLNQRAGQLSGGQRAQVALTLAVEKRPELLVLDEPVAGLDPLARRDFLKLLMESVAEHDLTVVLSSHLIGDIERVCNRLVVLAASRVQLMGDVHDLLATHRLLVGPRNDGLPVPSNIDVIDESATDRQRTLVVRTSADATFDARWTANELTLEDIVLAYLGQSARELRAARQARPEAETP
jgi:ABC-2 type transport system ATP-binding protein